MSLPLIRTPRLVLRPWTVNDVDALHELWTLPDVRRFLWDDVVIAREVAEQIVHSHLETSERRAVGYWAVQALPAPTEPSAEIAGFCGFRFIDESPEIELMYGMRREHWGKGLATEAARAALDYLWRSTTFDRVYARTDPPNERSVGVMRRLGMKHHSTTESMICYVLLRPHRDRG